MAVILLCFAWYEPTDAIRQTVVNAWEASEARAAEHTASKRSELIRFIEKARPGIERQLILIRRAGLDPDITNNEASTENGRMLFKNAKLKNAAVKKATDLRAALDKAKPLANAGDDIGVASIFSVLKNSDMSFREGDTETPISAGILQLVDEIRRAKKNEQQSSNGSGDAFRSAFPPLVYVLPGGTTRSNMKAGSVGFLHSFKCLQVVGSSDMIVTAGDLSLWITGHPTKNISDGMQLTEPAVFFVKGTKQYESKSGTRTIFEIEPIDVAAIIKEHSKAGK